MNADLTNFESGWFGLRLGLKEQDIDALIAVLKELKCEKTHFHYRSEFEGTGGVGDVEIYFDAGDQPGNLELEASVYAHHHRPAT